MPEQREGATFECQALAGTKYTPLFRGLFCSGITFEINDINQTAYEANDINSKLMVQIFSTRGITPISLMNSGE